LVTRYKYQTMFSHKLYQLARDYSKFVMRKDYCDSDHIEWRSESKKDEFYAIINLAKELDVTIQIPDLKTNRNY